MSRYICFTLLPNYDKITLPIKYLKLFLQLQLSCGKKANSKEYLVFACGELRHENSTNMQKLEGSIFEKIMENKDPVSSFF